MMWLLAAVLFLVGCVPPGVTSSWMLPIDRDGSRNRVALLSPGSTEWSVVAPGWITRGVTNYVVVDDDLLFVLTCHNEPTGAVALRASLRKRNAGYRGRLLVYNATNGEAVSVSQHFRDCHTDGMIGGIVSSGSPIFFYFTWPLRSHTSFRTPYEWTVRAVNYETGEPLSFAMFLNESTMALAAHNNGLLTWSRVPVEFCTKKGTVTCGKFSLQRVRQNSTEPTIIWQFYHEKLVGALTSGRIGPLGRFAVANDGSEVYVYLQERKKMNAGFRFEVIAIDVSSGKVTSLRKGSCYRKGEFRGTLLVGSTFWYTVETPEDDTWTVTAYKRNKPGKSRVVWSALLHLPKSVCRSCFGFPRLSPDERFLGISVMDLVHGPGGTLVKGLPGEVVLFDAATGKRTLTWTDGSLCTVSATRLWFLPDNSGVLVDCAFENKLVVFDRVTGEVQKSLPLSTVGFGALDASNGFYSCDSGPVRGTLRCSRKQL